MLEKLEKNKKCVILKLMKKIIISICLILVAFSVCFFVPKTNSVNAEATIETAEENSIKVFSGTNNVSLVGKEGDGKLSLFEELIQCETSNEPVMFYRNGTLYKNQYVIQKATPPFHIAMGYGASRPRNVHSKTAYRISPMLTLYTITK